MVFDNFENVHWQGNKGRVKDVASFKCFKCHKRMAFFTFRQLSVFQASPRWNCGRLVLSECSKCGKKLHDKCDNWEAHVVAIHFSILYGKVTDCEVDGICQQCFWGIDPVSKVCLKTKSQVGMVWFGLVDVQ